MIVFDFLTSIEIPDLKIIVNTTRVTESTVEINWKINGTTADITTVHVSIFNPKIDDLKFISKSLENTKTTKHCGKYTFQDLQPKIKYEACVIVRTTKNAEVSGCIKATTKTSGKYYII